MKAPLICLAAWIIVVVSLTIWMTKHGSPQHVWLFCNMLGWCK